MELGCWREIKSALIPSADSRVRSGVWGRGFVMLGRGGWGITGCRVYGWCRCVQVILEVENYGQEKEGGAVIAEKL
jgi:hypothetical protein